jgi:hypothetical protein
MGEEEVNLPLLIASFRPGAVFKLTFNQSHVCEKGIKGLAWALLSSVESVSCLEMTDDWVTYVVLNKCFELSP